MIRERAMAQRMHFFLAQDMRFRARLAAIRGDAAARDDSRKGAIGLFREMDMPNWTAIALLEHAEQLAADGRSKEAEAAVSESRGIFAELRATAWMERAAALDIGAPAVPA